MAGGLGAECWELVAGGWGSGRRGPGAGGLGAGGARELGAASWTLGVGQAAKQCSSKS